MMPEKLKKSLKDRMSRMKRNWSLKACKHPKTRTGSFDDQDQDHHHGKKNKSKSGLVIKKNHRNNRAKNAATLSDIDQFLIDNFKSLYLGDGELHGGGDNINNIGEETNQFNRDILTDQGAVGNPFCSVSSEELASCSEVNEEEKEIGPDKVMAVFTFSVSAPEDEFRQSMKEMVESRLGGQDGKATWEFMEEMLVCYLNLDDKTSYKYILNAFVDLIIALGHEQ